MILKYLRNLIFPTKEQKEEREAESKLEEELEFLRNLSAEAKSRPGYGSFSEPYKEMPGERLEYY